jgi:hypothetical protein
VIMLVVALALLGVPLVMPLGMPMAPSAMCPQCLPAAEAFGCVAALLALAVMIGLGRWHRFVHLLHSRLRRLPWVRPIEHPPQPLPHLVAARSRAGWSSRERAGVDVSVRGGPRRMGCALCWCGCRWRYAWP